MKTIVVFNMRGGIGKTTTAVTLAESLVQYNGLRVLLVDADPQRNASHRLCPLAVVDECSQPRHGKNISKYLSDCIIRNSFPDPTGYITPHVGTIHAAGQLDILMGSHDTVDADRHFAGKCTTDGDRALFHKLGAAFRHLCSTTEYDALVVDCPPGLSTLVQGSLCAADLLFVPMVAQSTSQLLYGSTEKQIAKHLAAIGSPVPDTLVIATMFEAASQTYFERIKAYFGSELKIKKQKSFIERELFSPEDGATIKAKYGSAEKELKTMASAVAQRVGLRMLGASATTRKSNTKETGNVGKRRGNSPSAVA